MKKCPFCAEEIQDEAIKCKHCSADLAGNLKESKETGETYGNLMLFIPFVAIMLMWFWVGNMNLLQSPGSTLNFMAVGTIVLTALFAYLESSQLGFGKQPKETKPVMYFFGMVLLWIVVYPLYLYQRSKKGKRNLVIGGIVVAVAFTISYYLLTTAITDRVNELRGLF